MEHLKVWKISKVWKVWKLLEKKSQDDHEADSEHLKGRKAEISKAVETIHAKVEKKKN